MLDFPVDGKNNIAFLHDFGIRAALVLRADNGNLLAVSAKENRDDEHRRKEIEKRPVKKNDDPFPRRHIVESPRVVVIVIFALESAKPAKGYRTYRKLRARLHFPFENRRAEAYRELVNLKTEFFPAMKCPNSCTTIININASIAITTYKMLSITLWNEQSDENINYYLIVWRMYF